MKKITVITGTEIEEKSTISFKFMFDSKAPREIYFDSGAWGWLSLKPKDADYFDPWAWAKGEPCVGDDGIPRWNIFLFRGGEGQVYFASGDHSEDQEVLKSIIKNVPNCCILMHRALFDRFKFAADEVDVDENNEEVKIVVHHFDGELSTS